MIRPSNWLLARNEKARRGYRDGRESKAVLWILFRKLEIGLP
jgi:hypothetical protein